MSLTGKILLGLYIVVSLPMVWLGASVLEARKRRADAIVKKDVQVLKVELDRQAVKLESGPIAEFEAELGEAVLPTAERKSLIDVIAPLKTERAGIDNVIAEMDKAMQEFNQSPAHVAFHQSLDTLLKAQSSPASQEDEIRAARDAYLNAVQQLTTARDRFETAFRTFSTAVRTHAQTGHGVEVMAASLARMQRARSYLETWKNLQLSEYDVYRTRYADMVNELLTRRQQIQLTADSSEVERQVRQEETEADREKLGLTPQQLRAEVGDRKMARMSPSDLDSLPEQELRDALRQDLPEPDLKFVRHVRAVKDQIDDDIAKSQVILDARQAKQQKAEVRLKALLADNSTLVNKIARSEKAIDLQRGVPTVLASESGASPKGKIVRIDDKSGIVGVDVGLRAGVTRGVRLHVYRTEPQPKYLGIIEISSAESDLAVGQVLDAFRQMPIQVGDIVSPDIGASQ